MEDQLISFETAKLAKEKGFNEKVFKQYKNDNFLGRISKSIDVVIGPYEELLLAEIDCYAAPTQSLLQKWLRENHNYVVLVAYRETSDKAVRGINSVYFDTEIYHLIGGDAFKIYKFESNSDVYEDALEIGLQKALKLIKS